MSAGAGPAAPKRAGSDSIYRFTTRQAREPESDSGSDSGSGSDSDLPEVTLTPSAPAPVVAGGRYANFREEQVDRARRELAELTPDRDITLDKFEDDVYKYVARMKDSVRSSKTVKGFRVENEYRGYNTLLPSIDSGYFEDYFEGDTPPPPSLNVENATWHFYKRENLLETAGRIPHEDTRRRYKRIEKRVKALSRSIENDFSDVFWILKGRRLPSEI